MKNFAGKAGSFPALPDVRENICVYPPAGRQYNPPHGHREFPAPWPAPRKAGAPPASYTARPPVPGGGFWTPPSPACAGWPSSSQSGPGVPRPERRTGTAGLRRQHFCG